MVLFLVWVQLSFENQPKPPPGGSGGLILTLQKLHEYTMEIPLGISHTNWKDNKSPKIPMVHWWSFSEPTSGGSPGGLGGPDLIWENLQEYTMQISFDPFYTHLSDKETSIIPMV